MITEETVYETADGKQHATLSKAEEHAANQARELLDARLKPLLGAYSSSGLFKVVMALVPDYKAAVALAAELEAVL